MLLFSAVGLYGNNISAQSIVYVNHLSREDGDGTSWANAFPSLQDAIAGVQAGDEIWVARGVYKPDDGTGIDTGDRDATFVLPNGVSLIGGFEGGENSQELRDWEANRTILSGDLLGNDGGPLEFANPLRMENSKHVIEIFDIWEEVTIDGFTISGGMASAPPDHYGGAIQIKSFPFPEPVQAVHIRNCILSENASVAGTIRITSFPQTAYPVLVVENTIIENNVASTAAGIQTESSTTALRDVTVINNTSGQGTALNIIDSDLFISGSTFAYNTSSSFGAIFVRAGEGRTTFIWDSAIIGNNSLRFGAGGMTVDNSNLISINNIFSGNSTPDIGGALVVGAGTAAIINNVFAYNSAGISGGAIETIVSNTKISNSIFWKNVAQGPNDFADVTGNDTLQISHSLIEGVLPSGVINNGGLISEYPFFLDPDGADNVPGTIDDNFTLLIFSPAIDAGANDSVFVDVLDIDGDGNVTESWPTDFAGNIRIFDGGSGVETVDMGILEHDSVPISIEFPWHPEEDIISHSGISVYPNPSASGFTLTWDSPISQIVDFRLYDVTGRFIQTISDGLLTRGQSIYIQMNGLAPGLYLLREERSGVMTRLIALK